MDICEMSVAMHQASLQSAVSMSVLKMAMNSWAEASTQITNMMSDMGIDTSIDTNIDTRV